MQGECTSISNTLGTFDGCLPFSDEKLLNNLSNYHLWELSLLTSHVDAKVAMTTNSIFKAPGQRETVIVQEEVLNNGADNHFSILSNKFKSVPAPRQKRKQKRKS